MRGLNIYVDESSQSGHRFIALGGIWIAHQQVMLAEERLMAVRRMHRLDSELKWTKLSPSRMAAYEAFVDTFFALHAEGIIDWHAMFLEAGQIDHDTYSRGDKELGFNKLLFQFLFHRIRIYPQARAIRIYLDARTTRHDPDATLRPILNNALRHALGIARGPVAHVHFLNSKESQLLQINGIILGAMAAVRNGHHLAAGASAAKRKVAARILTRAGLSDITKNTLPGARFSIWNFRLRPKKKAPRS